MKKYLIAVVMSAVLAIGLLVYGAAVAVPVAAQSYCPNPHEVCTTTCQDFFGQQKCTTVCKHACY